MTSYRPPQDWDAEFVPDSEYGKRVVLRAAGHGLKVRGPRTCIKRLMRGDDEVITLSSLGAIMQYLDRRDALLAAAALSSAGEGEG